MGFSLVFPFDGSGFFFGFSDGSCWERDRHSEARERAREREAEKKTHGAANHGSGRDPRPPSPAHFLRGR
jgi:hypothetical protein